MYDPTRVSLVARTFPRKEYRQGREKGGRGRRDGDKERELVVGGETRAGAAKDIVQNERARQSRRFPSISKYRLCTFS